LKAVLETILELQGLNCKLKDAEKELNQIPGMREKSKRALTTCEVEFDTVVERRDIIGKERRTLEGDLQTLATKISSYKDKLMSVKTNKEYEAIQSEIGKAKEKASEFETKILLAMEEGDQMAVEVDAQEQHLNAGKAEHGQKTKEFDGEENKYKARIADLQAQIAEVQKKLPPEFLDRYRKIEKLRDGIVIARIKGTICGVCRMRVRPQMLVEIKHHDIIHECEYCTRFLYWADTPLTDEETDESNEGSESDGAQETGV